MTTIRIPTDPARDIRERNAARLDQARGRLALIEVLSPRSRDVLTLHNELSLELSTAGAECGLLSEVHPDAGARKAAETVVQDVVAFSTELQQHRGLYDALGAVATSDALERRVVDLVRRDMRRSGIELDDAAKARVRALRNELTLITQEFARNIRDDVKAIEIAPTELDGMPDDYRAAHPAGANGLARITTEYPDYIPFMSYAKSDRARRQLALTNNRRALPRNLELLDQMLAKRHELASVLGYPTWAHYATEVLMTGTPENAGAFIERAYAATVDAGRAERAALLEMKRREGLPGDGLHEHELTYLTERVKAETLRFDARSVRPYFEYRAVRQAILDLNSELFALTFTKVDESLWHPSVETFDVTVDGRAAGRISLDMHPREGKFKHAACFGLRPGVGGKQLPHYVLVCNFPDPAAQAGPALMEHREVVTFFHEFGHLVHSIVRGGVPWTRLGGVTERDFVEAPSQFLEEWIYDFDVLRRFAKHVETGEPITTEIVQRLRAARDFGRGVFVQRQLFLSAISLGYHDREPASLDTTKLLFELAERYSPTTLDPENRFQASFGHLEGYTAAYVTYIWSLVISKDMLSLFKEHGLLDLPQARRYRDIVLAQGGTKPASLLLEEFLGRPFSFDEFQRWLAPPA